MQSVSVDQLEKQFKAEGYSNPLIHAKAKFFADQKFAEMQPAPVLKSLPKPIMQSCFQIAIRLYIKNGGQIKYLAEKQSHNSSKKVAVAQQPVVRYRSLHKLTPQESIELLLARGVA